MPYDPIEETLVLLHHFCNDKQEIDEEVLLHQSDNAPQALLAHTIKVLQEYRDFTDEDILDLVRNATYNHVHPALEERDNLREENERLRAEIRNLENAASALQAQRNMYRDNLEKLRHDVYANYMRATP